MRDTVALELQGVEALGRWSRPSRPPRRAPGPARAGRAAQGPLPSRTAALPMEPATPTLDGRAPTPRARPLRRGRRGPRRHRRCHRSRWCSQDHPGAGREHAGDTVRAEEGLGDHVRLQRKVPAQRRVAHSRRRSAVEHVGEGHRKSSFNQSASPGGGQRTECRWGRRRERRGSGGGRPTTRPQPHRSVLAGGPAQHVGLEDHVPPCLRPLRRCVLVGGVKRLGLSSRGRRGGRAASRHPP